MDELEDISVIKANENIVPTYLKTVAWWWNSYIITY